MVSGHSFLPSGEDFGVDEKQTMKYESVFTPAEWMAIAKRARKKHKFDVALLEARDFLEFKSLKELIVNRKVNTTNEKRLQAPRRTHEVSARLGSRRPPTSIVPVVKRRDPLRGGNVNKTRNYATWATRGSPPLAVRTKAGPCLVLRWRRKTQENIGVRSCARHSVSRTGALARKRLPHDGAAVCGRGFPAHHVTRAPPFDVRRGAHTRAAPANTRRRNTHINEPPAEQTGGGTGRLLPRRYRRLGRL
ncbi:hypothetical protein LSAT2_006465 [Lamellibrachia satsuma]|nr:hypothetical protein LSAT2_006465 [Lamellibrachia satsuma]